MSGVSVRDIDLFFEAYQRDFNGLCQAAMWQIVDRFGSPDQPRAYGSAVEAMRASRIYTTNPDQAQPGDFGYWDERMGRYGHVALWSGERWIMGSSRVTEMFGGKSKNVGLVEFGQYPRTGFVGFAPSNGLNDLLLLDETPTLAADLIDWEYWEPAKGTGLVKRVQTGMSKLKDRNGRQRYTGRLDDEAGPLTRKAIQETLWVSGIFRGTIDGVISRGGCYGMQRYGARFGGYKGKIDGKPRELSWEGFARGLGA